MNMSKKEQVVLKEEHFERVWPLEYGEAWYSEKRGKIEVLEDDIFCQETTNDSWSSEVEMIHEEPTKTGWIDVYERERVIDTFSEILSIGEKTVVEFGSSAGYMIEEIEEAYPSNMYIATDLMLDGLQESYKRNPSIRHIRCDFTQAPFKNDSIDVVFSLNVLEHIEDDVKTIAECYRILKDGGYALFVVPRGDGLYDYFDEMLFHKRRYARKELYHKCQKVGFRIEDNFHFAWLCYPAFYLKKKWNRHVGKKLSQEEKMERVKEDINNAMSSPLAIGMMHFEHALSKVVRTPFGVREFILCKKQI